MDFELLDLKGNRQGFDSSHFCNAPSLAEIWTDEVYQLYLSLRKHQMLDDAKHLAMGVGK